MKSKLVKSSATMKRYFGIAVVLNLVAASVFTGCKKNDDDVTPVDTSKQTVTIADSVSTSRTLYADTIYLLKGFVYVTNNSTLTIQAGAIIKGDKDSKGTLLIERGSKIMAAGTVDKPIVFTSNQPKGSRSYGDWGGLVICGKAVINQPGGEAQVEGGPRSFYGGTDDADNSGVLSYVRVEFSGIALAPDKEINGLTLGAVGSGTTIDHIQVSYSGDDSYEWFGGTVNAKYLVAFRGLDDDFDTDFGFSGKVQFGVALRDPNNADVSGSNGFESDNDAGGNATSPYTNAIFSNISVFGPKQTLSSVINTNFKRGAHLRRNTKECIYNSVIAGFPYGFLLDGSTTEANALANELQFANNVIAGCDTALKTTGTTGTLNINTWTAANDVTILTNTSDLNVANPFNLSAPDFMPNSGSALLSGASFAAANLTNSFFTSVAYRGAFGSVNWTATWCNFDPQNTDY